MSVSRAILMTSKALAERGTVVPKAVLGPSKWVAIISEEELRWLRECRDMVEIGISTVKPNGLARWFSTFKKEYGSVFRAEKL